MGDIDSRTRIEAGQSYLRLRRRHWRCLLGVPALLVVAGVIAAPVVAFDLEVKPLVPDVEFLPKIIPRTTLGVWQQRSTRSGVEVISADQFRPAVDA